VTAPVFPVWYDTTKTWLDTEFVLKNAFQTWLTATNVLSWLPQSDVILATVQGGGSYLRIFRTGGHLDGDTQRKSYVDAARVQFAAIANTRDQSWDIINFVRTVLWAYFIQAGRISGGGITAIMSTIGEVEGPQLTPVEFRDERLVPVTFDLEFQRPKGLPDYRIPLGL
jgi:hypothetical protein